MEQPYFKEVFEYPIQEFKQHLENPSNDRIIFSGKYGTGKTTFLEDFFKSENQNDILKSDKYDVYRLFPINYSIASNEDIIRYIKYDIIIELLGKIKSTDEIELDFIDTLPEFIKNNSYKVAAAMIYMIPQLGKSIGEAFEKIDALKDKFLKFHKEANESSGDKMVSYLESLETKEGSIYENDIITKIISNIIEKNTSKESVLIVDDIDRLDPEHVFRILNVFAAHFDSNVNAGTKNKFNFDKIIIVCDFNNIRNLFHHRYGDNVDFMGYIDKFYSSDIYSFDNKKAILKIHARIMYSINFEVNHGNSIQYIQDLYFSNDFLANIINTFIDRNFISLRNIVKMYKLKINHHDESIFFGTTIGEKSSFNIPMLAELKLLRDYLGDYKNMEKIFEQCLISIESVDKYSVYFSRLIIILSSNTHRFSDHSDFLYKHHGTEIVVEGRDFNNTRNNSIQLFTFTGSYNNNSGVPQRGASLPITLEMFWNALLDTIKKLHQIGYLK